MERIWAILQFLLGFSRLSTKRVRRRIESSFLNSTKSFHHNSHPDGTNSRGCRFAPFPGQPCCYKKLLKNCHCWQKCVFGGGGVCCKNRFSGTDLNNCGKPTDARSPPVDSWSRDFNLKIFNCSKSKLKTRIHQIFLLIHLIYLDDLIRLIQLVHGLKDLNKICLGGWGLADSPGDLDTHDLDWNWMFIDW